jgi:hypothetical protein
VAKKYDFAVVGGGIAGIAIAELLQRSGKKVILLEAEDRLASASSAEHQGWFHTGALYAAFPSGHFFKMLIKNIENILKYYSGFPNMNLRPDNPLTTNGRPGWFNDSPVYYFYVNPAEKEISFFKKPIWFLATQVAKSRLEHFKKLDFSKNIEPQIGNLMLGWNFKKNASLYKFNFNFEKQPTVLSSSDCTLNCGQLINDLIRSFIASGGTIRLSSRALKIAQNGVEIISNLKNTSFVEASKVILAVGRFSDKFLGDRKRLKVLKSPLLVITPQIATINFVRLSLRKSEIFNHIYHNISECGYSVLGNAFSYKADEEINHRELKKELIGRAVKFFNRTIDPETASLFFGYKAEIPGVSELRNYEYHIIIKEDSIITLPGKLSFAFSLAVKFCKTFGITPPVGISRMEGKTPFQISRPKSDILAAEINMKNIENRRSN